MHRLVETLQLCRATFGEPDAVEACGKVDYLPAGEHLAGPRERAEPPSDVQGGATVAAFDRHGLASVEPYPNGEWKGGSAIVSSTNRCCRAAAPRMAERGEPNTTMASSPRSSITVPR